MTDLDQVDRFSRIDVADALGVTLGSWEQWQVPPGPGAGIPSEVTAVVVVGMGGSGIAGDVLVALAAERLGLPVIVHKDTGLPAFAGPATLVIVVSYSGSTGETLAAAERAINAGARVVAVTSGGPLADLAAGAGCPVVLVPGGHQPRHALGWLTSALLHVCGLDDDLAGAAQAQREVAAACGPGVTTESNRAKQLAAGMAGCDMVVCWGAGRVGATAAQRLKCQLNEHAKLPAYWVALPEVTHNEVVGWERDDPGPASAGLVMLRDVSGETLAARSRVEPALRQVVHRFAWTAEAHAPAAGTTLSRLAALLMLVDLASVYAAIARDVDPTPVDSIDRLKAAVAADGGGREQP